MAIKSWDQDLRIPRFGTIRLGEKTAKGNPIALNYFVVPDEVKKVYGEKPTELDILLPSENMDEVLTAWYKRYGKNAGLICRGDEQTALVSAFHLIGHPQDYPVRMGDDGEFYDAQDRQLLTERLGGTRWARIRCDPTTCPFAARVGDSLPSCRPVAILNFLMPDVPGAIGVYSITTSSKKSYQNLLAGITLIRNRLGYISDIPLKLRVSMVEFHPVVNGKKITTKKPIIDIRLAVSLSEALELAKERRLQLTNRVHLPFEPVDESVPPETFYHFPDDEQETKEERSGEYNAPELPGEPCAAGGEGDEDIVLPPDYDNEALNGTTGASESKEPAPTTPEKPEQKELPSQKPGQNRGTENVKLASANQIAFINTLAAARLDLDRPDTWLPLLKKLRDGGSLTSSEASKLITDLKLMPPLNLEAGEAKTPPKMESKGKPKPEQQPEQKPEEQPEQNPGQHPDRKPEESEQPQAEAPSPRPPVTVADGETITFMVVGVPKATTSLDGLAITAKGKIEGSDAVWELSWSSKETVQVRPNGYKYQAIVKKVNPEARKAFVRDLKVQS